MQSSPQPGRRSNRNGTSNVQPTSGVAASPAIVAAAALRSHKWMFYVVDTDKRKREVSTFIYSYKSSAYLCVCVCVCVCVCLLCVVETFFLNNF